MLGCGLVAGAAHARENAKEAPAAQANAADAKPVEPPAGAPAAAQPGAGVALRVVPVSGVPETLAEAVAALAQIIPESDLAELGEDPDGAVLEALGLAVRSRWNLWEPSPLVDYFHQKGVQHPDHMSGIILQAWMDVRAGRKLDEAAMFRNFPSWLNSPADDLPAHGDLGGLLATVRARVTAVARQHFENPSAVVVFSHAFDPAKEARPIEISGSGRTYQQVLDAACRAAQLSYQVVSPSEIRLSDAPASEPTRRQPR